MKFSCPGVFFDEAHSKNSCVGDVDNFMGCEGFWFLSIALRACTYENYKLCIFLYIF